MGLKTLNMVRYWGLKSLCFPVFADVAAEIESLNIAPTRHDFGCISSSCDVLLIQPKSCRVGASCAAYGAAAPRARYAV